MEYYYSKLSSREQIVYKKMITAITNGAQTIRIEPCFTGEPIQKIMWAIDHDHPELFYFDFCQMKMLYDSSKVVCHLNYRVNPAMRQAAINDINRKANAILDLMKAQQYQTDFEKCRWIHNYLVKNIHYDYEAYKSHSQDSFPEAHSIVGVFVNKRAVCEGISKAFKYLCDKLQIEASIACGIARLEDLGENNRHAWNIVKLGDEYTHIDVTWDLCLSQSIKFTRYDYFCLPDSSMQLDHVYHDYPACSTDRWSYYRRTNKLFSNTKDLNQYLKRELKQGNKIIYFKTTPSIVGSDWKEAITKRVEVTFSRYCKYPWTCVAVFNENQYCFFCRIE